MKEMKFFKKVETVIIHPHRFFEKIKDEKNVWKVFQFYFIFAFLSAVINTLFILPDFIKSKLTLSFPYFVIIVLMVIIMVLLISLALVALFFVSYFIFHIIIKIFNGKENYKQTFKLVYAATPLLIASLIPYYGTFKIIFYPLVAVALVDSAYIQYVGLIKLHKMSKENSIVVVIIGLIAGFLILKYLKYLL